MARALLPPLFVVVAVGLAAASAGCEGDLDARDAAPGLDGSRPPADGAISDAPGSDGALADGGTSSTERAGPVRLVSRALHDDGGPFVALGASMFWAAWAYRNDRPRLERNLAWLASHGFHYVRVLGVVGDPAAEDYWDGREIEWQWPDYDDVIAGLTDLAWDTYGLRIEWTLIGDGQVSIPAEADRYALVDRFLAMSATRSDAIIHFEIANEHYQNGFDGDTGVAQLRALTAYMRDRTEILVAASAPFSSDCGEIARVYGAPGEIADLATIHFDRDIGREEGRWGPVWQPWSLADCGAFVGSNNEPIGPGASVSMEDDPTRLAAAALTTWVAGLPLHVFHSGAGVRGDIDISEMAGADAFAHVVGLVPADLPAWDRRHGDESDAPLRFFAEDADGTMIPDASWTDVLEPPRSGVVRAFGAIQGTELVVVPIGILGSVTVEARRAMSIEVWEPVSGARLAEHELDAGERVVLAGAEALVVRGRYR